jgi:hypothetical protein
MREKRHRYTGHGAPCVRRSHRPAQVARTHPPGRRRDSRNGNGNLRHTGPRGSVQATASLTLPGTFPQETPEQRPMTSLRPSEVLGCRSAAGISVLSAEGEGFEPSVDQKPTTVFETASKRPQCPLQLESASRGNAGENESRQPRLCDPSATERDTPARIGSGTLGRQSGVSADARVPQPRERESGRSSRSRDFPQDCLCSAWVVAARAVLLRIVRSGGLVLSFRNRPTASGAARPCQGQRNTPQTGLVSRQTGFVLVPGAAGPNVEGVAPIVHPSRSGERRRPV